MNPSVRTAADWVKVLDLKPHPEGGSYREVYRSADSIPPEGLPKRFSGPRSVMTSIYYLLEGGQFSTFHRIKSDELWHFYAGDGMTVYVLDDGGLREIRLGSDPAAGEVMLSFVPAGTWFAGRCEVPNGYALAGCTVAPGFSFDDFEIATRASLLGEFPEHAQIVTELTPDD